MQDAGLDYQVAQAGRLALNVISFQCGVFRILRPGARGTRRYVNRYGFNFVCALKAPTFGALSLRSQAPQTLHHRRNYCRRSPSRAPQTRVHRFPHPNAQVLVRVAYQETGLRRRIKAAGAKWQARRKLWRLPCRKVVELGIEARVVGPVGEA